MTSCENCSCEIEKVFEVKFVFETREGMNKFMRDLSKFTEQQNKKRELTMIHNKIKKFQKQFNIKTFSDAKYEYVEHLRKINNVKTETI